LAHNINYFVRKIAKDKKAIFHLKNQKPNLWRLLVSKTLQHALSLNHKISKTELI